MVVTPGIRDSARLRELLAPHEAVRSIGTRPNPLYVARALDPGDAKPHLLVAELLLGAARDATENGPDRDFVANARRVATLASANVPRVRELVLRQHDVVVFGNFIDGEKLGELWDEMPLEIALRVVVDVLSGLGAFHNLRDLQLRPMHLAHGEVSPATILFGLDGTARLLHCIGRIAPHAPAADREGASFGYLAPEVHAGQTYDASADVFGAGVLLWEAVAGSRLFTESDPGAIVTRVQTGIAPVTLRETAPWARGLVDVAAKALAASPADRWPTAAAMAAEIRRAAGLHLAPSAEASAFAKRVIGPRVKARRDELESCSGIETNAAERVASRPPTAPEPTVDPESVTTDVEMRPPFLDVPEAEPLLPSPASLPPSAASTPVHADIAVAVSALAPSDRVFEEMPRMHAVPTPTDPGKGPRRRLLWASIGLVGASAVGLAGWRAGHLPVEPNPGAREKLSKLTISATASAPSDEALAQPLPAMSPALLTGPAAPSSIPTPPSSTASAPPALPHAAAHTRKSATPLPPKSSSTAHGAHGKGPTGSPVHSPAGKSRNKPAAKPSAL